MPPTTPPLVTPHARRWRTLALVLFACLAPATAHAVGGPSAGAVTAQTVKLPAGPGSVRGLADNATVSAFTGQIQYAVPIELPAASGGLRPSLSLGYAGELGNGPLGVGWTLSQAGIQRSLRLGVPSYDESDELELVGLGTTGQLVKLPNGEYRLEHQGNSYVGTAVNGGFELQDPSGTIYRFGLSPDARKASGTQTSFWYLEEVRDITGQTIAYRYQHDGGEVYLAEIAWGPEVGGERAFRAELVYEGRSDAVVSYRTGFRVESARRLAQVDVWSFGEVQRQVELAYEDTFALTRLASVRVLSADGTESLPEVTFTYAAPQIAALQSVPDIGGWKLERDGTSLFDVDDDGAMDLLQLKASGSGHVYRRNLGGSFDATARTVTGAAGATLGSVRLLDLTGDSGAEMVWQQGSRWNVFQLGDSTTTPGAKEWKALGALTGIPTTSLGSVAIADLDGDYRMDVLHTSGTSIQVRFGTENGLVDGGRQPAIDPARPSILPGNASTQFPDINGDGLADVAYLAASELQLYLGRGNGTFERYRDVRYPWTETVQTSQIRLGDLDRDGLLDVAVVRAGNVAWYRGQANGSVATTAVLLTRPPGSDLDTVVALADANGNGSEDLIWSSSTAMWILDLAGPTSAGMLVAIDNGLGQRQAFGYEASTQLALAAAQTGASWTTRMPLSVPVATRTRLELASGEPARSSRLDVRDGIYDRGERRFIGFRQATLTRPDPADGATGASLVRTTQRFHEGSGDDRALRGQVVYERVEDGKGTLFRETTLEVAAVTVAGLPASEPRLRRAIVRSTEVAHYEGRPAALRTRIEFGHDDEGRVIEERNSGRLDLDGDETLTRRRYTAGRSSVGVRDKVCEELIVQAGTPEITLGQTRTFYGDEDAVADLCDASNGWPRVVRQYLASEERWVDANEIRYDRRGNPVQTRAGGVTRTLAYDEYGLKPIAESVQPTADRTLRWEVTWDYVQGVASRVVDASGVAMDMTYDGLGRLTSTARAGHNPHIRYRYQWGAPRSYVETFTYDGDASTVPALPEAWSPSGGWRHAVAVSNSAGEPLFTATRLTDTGWLVSGHLQRDALGRPVATADAFSWDGTLAGLSALALPTGVPVRTVEYDALDRAVRRTLPGGGEVAYAYRAFETTTSTDTLAPVTTYLDGLARVWRTTRTVSGVTEAVDAIYDGAGRITSMSLSGQSGPPVVHRYEYDSLGRLAFATDPDIGDRNFEYDDGNRLVAHTNGAGQTIEYTYDGAGRLATVEADDGSRFVYHYDAPRDAAFGNLPGRLAWVEEPTGIVELGYDGFGHQNRLRRSVNADTADQTTTFAPSGLVRSVDYGGGVAVALHYDAAGRPTDLGDLWHVDEQDAAGRILRERFGNDIVQTHERNALGQPTRIQLLRNGTSALYDAAVTYDDVGAITAVSDDDHVGLDHSSSFTYDGAARLTEAALGAGTGQYQFAYRYDGLQNMVRREARGPKALGALVGEYRYGGTPSAPRGPRQLTSVVPDAGAGSPASAVTTTFDYDGAGRMTRQGAMSLEYNGFDQLVRVRGLDGGGVVEHAYGYDGLRVVTRSPAGTSQLWFSRDVAQNPDGTREHYVRLGDRLIARITAHPSATARIETRSRGIWFARTTEIAFGAGGLLLVVGAFASSRRGRATRSALSAILLVVLVMPGCSTSTLASREALLHGGTVHYYHQAIGAGPSILTRADGSIEEERRYEPFGEEVDAYRELPGGGSETGAIDYHRDAHNVLNKESDPATGWSDHGARWMAPETGRWHTPDPPVKAPDPSFMVKPWALHPYQYVEQNPITFWDPDGRQPALRDGSGAWNAESPGFGDYAKHFSWMRIAQAADVIGMPNASRHMLHYLGNSGSPIQVDVRDMLDASSHFRDGYASLVADSQMEAERWVQAELAKGTRFQSTWTEGGTIDSARRGGYITKNIDRDWFFAVGGFTYYTKSRFDVRQVGDQIEIQMQTRLHVFDRYNWDEKKKVEIAGVEVTDESLGRLHRVGLAREYEVHGTSAPATTTWRLGDAIPGAVLPPSGGR
jgi:RHS repeat-associated protein